MTQLGNSLRKVSGCSGCPDAGGLSSAATIAGNGSVEFAVGRSVGLYQVGLSAASMLNANAEFALRIREGHVEVRENGAYVADVRARSTDVFRIQMINGTVTYLKNGAVFWTSTAPATSAMRVNTVIYDSGVTTMPATMRQR